MASALSFTMNKTVMLGPSSKMIVGTLVLANPHDATGDVIDLSSYFQTAVAAGWMVDDFEGYKVDYLPVTSATGRVHAWRGDNNAGADGVMITAATIDLSGVSGEYAFVGY